MKIVQKIVGVILICLVPVILVLLSVRLVLTPIYIQIEYRMPYFPEDSYGFKFDDRFYWANISRLYLVNQDDIDYLADQYLDADTPLYNERELKHMLDVKIVLRAAMGVLGGAGLFVGASGVWAYKTGWWVEYKRAISRGGWLTVGLIVALLFYLVVNFNSLFITFHRIFFEGDTWIFSYSDTLIRLFPVVFWRDVFVWVGVLTLSGGLFLGYFLGKQENKVETAQF